MTDPALTVAVTHRFGALQLQVATAFAAGRVTALLGPSGAGKTSLLRLLAGLDRPARGSVVAGNTVWSDTEHGVFVPPHERRVGFVFQDSALFTHLSVADNLAYAERRARRRDASATAALDAAEVIALLELTPLLKQAVPTLSGGEQRRVALARALLSKPRWLLLDEPLAGLDQRRRLRFARLLESIQRRFAIPTILVTHQLDDVARLVDDVVILDAGRITQAGPAAGLLQGLDHSLHSGGSVLLGIWRGEDARLLTGQVEVDGVELLVPLLERLTPAEATARIDQPVRLYLRPEDVAIARTAATDSSIRNQLPCVIEAIEGAQDSPFVDLRLRLGSQLGTAQRSPPESQQLRARVTRASQEQLGLALGQPVFALIKAMSLAPP